MNSIDKRFWISIAAVVVIALILLVSGRFASAPSAAVPASSDSGSDSSLSDMATATPAMADDGSSSSTPTYTYSCDANKSMAATFHLPKDDFANVHVSDGRSFILAHAVSADGARYANANDSIVFWTKGVTAFLQENGTTTYANCVAQRFP